MKLVPSLVIAAALFLECTAVAQESSAKPDVDTAAAKSSAGESDQEKYKFTARSNLVFLPTRVEDKKGHTIYGLKPEQFVVEDNGVRQEVRIDEDPESEGLSLVVAIQCSRSADKEFDKIKRLSLLIDEIVGEAPREVAIISYGEGIYTLGNFSSDPDAPDLALSRLKSCGSYSAVSIDAVEYAISMLQRRQNRFRRAILLISEGRDHGSHARLHDVVAELGISDTVIYTFAFAPAKDEIIRTLLLGDPNARPRPPENPLPPAPPVKDSSSASSAPPPEQNPILIHPPPLLLPPEFTALMNALRRSTAPQLASLSGGEYISFTTQKGFEDGMHRISNQVHNYYLLSFKPASTPTFSLHSLRVRVPDYPGAVIKTRKTYWSGMLESSGNPPAEIK